MMFCAALFDSYLIRFNRHNFSFMNACMGLLRVINSKLYEIKGLYWYIEGCISDCSLHRSRLLNKYRFDPVCASANPPVRKTLNRSIFKKCLR